MLEGAAPGELAARGHPWVPGGGWRQGCVLGLGVGRGTACPRWGRSGVLRGAGGRWVLPHGQSCCSEGWGGRRGSGMRFGVGEPEPRTGCRRMGGVLAEDGVVSSTQRLKEILGCSPEERGGTEEGDRGSGLVGLR